MKPKSVANPPQLFTELGQQSPQHDQKQQSKVVQSLAETLAETERSQQESKFAKEQAINTKETSLIKVRHISNESDCESIDKDEDIMIQADESQQKSNPKQMEKGSNQQKQDFKKEGPILYKSSDEDQEEEGRISWQQDIPQSSRRKLNLKSNKQTRPPQINVPNLTNYQQRKISQTEYSSQGSPTKLIPTKKSHKNNNSPLRKSNPNSRRQNKKTQNITRQLEEQNIMYESSEIQQQEEKLSPPYNNRESTQVFSYDQSEQEESSEEYEEQEYSYESGSEQAQQQLQAKEGNGQKQFPRRTQKQPSPSNRHNNKMKKPLSSSLSRSSPLQSSMFLKNKAAIFKSQSFYTLVNAQIPPNNLIKIAIKRIRTDEIFSKLVIYECYLLQDRKHILTCIKNRFLKTTSHFEFYRNKSPHLQPPHEQIENLYGILDSNFSGTQFVFKSVFNADTNSEKATGIDRNESILMREGFEEDDQEQGDEVKTTMSDKQYYTTGNGASRKSMFANEQSSEAKINFSNIQGTTAQEQIVKKENVQTGYVNVLLKEENIKETCYICFKASFFGLAGQRDVSLYKKTNKKLPTLKDKFSAIKQSVLNSQNSRYNEFQNRKAQKGKNGLELDFKDGVQRIESSKNLILEDKTAQEALYFGKVKEDIYTVSIGHPLSIIEGIAFGIANLERKFFVN